VVDTSESQDDTNQKGQVMKIKYMLLVGFAAMLLFASSITAEAQCCAPATISGTVTDTNSQPLAGVVMTLGGYQNRIVTTNASGFYSFPSTPVGQFYVVTAQLANYTFSPDYYAFSLLANRPNQDFTGTLGSLTTSPLDTAEFFVRQQYVDLLKREPDESGLNFWSGDLKACTTLACRVEKRRNVMCAFIASGEYQARFTGPATTICQ
jgi:hypothetical protein